MADITINVTDVVKSNNVKTFSNKTMSYTQNNITVHSSGITNYLGFTIQGMLSTANANPADGITYYGGANPAVALITTAALKKMFPPKASTLKSVVLHFSCTAGSNENSTAYIRQNNTTDTTITTVIDLSASTFSVTTTGLSIAFNGTTDYFELKWVAPTWATNPTNVTCSFIAYFE